jgi:hypothetical protein
MTWVFFFFFWEDLFINSFSENGLKGSFNDFKKGRSTNNYDNKKLFILIDREAAFG